MLKSPKQMCISSCRLNLGRTLLWALVALGVAIHLGVALVADNHLTSPWSGGGDTRQYVELARNLLVGDGYTFAHQPTAFRAPLYPLLLSLLMRLLPEHWLVALRGLQFLASLATAWLCGQLAKRWFSALAGPGAIVAALFSPTLVYFTGEVLTECAAALFGLVFLRYLDEAVRTTSTRALVLLGLAAGIAALERFNFAALALIAFVTSLFWVPRGVEGAPSRAASHVLKVPDRWHRLLVVAAACAIVVTPWLIHTAIAFGGQALYSTHTGFAAVEGVLMPLGRTQPGETDMIEQSLGWGNWEVESNDPERLKLAPEPELNRQAWRVTFRLWRERRWGLAPIAAQKLSAFWFSTDQVMYTHSFSWRNRVVRWVGVAVYWAMLLLGVIGWFRLRGAHPEIAGVLLLYAVALTAMHLPLTMNTRLRSPLLDPLIAALAGGGWLSITGRLQPTLASFCFIFRFSNLRNTYSTRFSDLVLIQNAGDMRGCKIARYVKYHLKCILSVLSGNRLRGEKRL